MTYQPPPSYPPQGGPYQGPRPVGYPAPHRPPRNGVPIWAWLLVGLAIAGFFGVVGLGVVNGAGKTSDKASAELALPAAGVAPVRDGQLQFTVKKVETGVTHTGGSVFGEDPLGQFIVVTVEIANVGTIPASAPSWDDQQLIDDQGRRYDGHWGASDSLNKDDPRDYNPGLSATVRIAFDVPEGTQPVAIKFADSMLSSGVEASLR